MNLDETALLDLFRELVPAESWEQLESADGGKRRPQIYRLAVVVWLMVYQRLHPRGTQQEAVRQLQRGVAGTLVEDCKRIREGRISGATGGYAQACGRIRVAAMKQITDRVLQALAPLGDPPARRVYVLDGTTFTVEHEADLMEWFPAARNQYRRGHWGIVQMVVVHDLASGIPLRPHWGAMYGERAGSEQLLAQQAMQQIPAGSVLMGDANFGVFATAYGAQRQGLQMVLRLSSSRCRALLGRPANQKGEWEVSWRASGWELRRHSELTAEAQVTGRVIIQHLKGHRQALCLFTTLPDAAEQVVRLYLQRWNLESDLRSLKTTLRMHHLGAKTPEGVEKELLAAVIAYALVRAFMAVAAQRASLLPRALSFTGSWVVLNSAVGDLCQSSVPLCRRALDSILRDIAQKKLPTRKKRRSFPRAVWGHRPNFPRRKT